MYTRDMFDNDCIELNIFLKEVCIDVNNGDLTFDQIPEETFSKLIQLKNHIKQANVADYTEETFSDLSQIYKFICIVIENKQRMDELSSDIINNTIERGSTVDECNREIELCKKFIVYWLRVSYSFIKDVADKTEIKKEPLRKKSIFDIFKRKN